MLLTVAEVAKLLNVTGKVVYRWMGQENMPVYRINDQCRFNRAEIVEWATARGIPLSADALTASSTDRTASPSLTETARTGGIVYGLRGSDKTSVLRSVVDLMSLPEEVDREFLYHVLLARENLGSTGIGEGVAIPHVRNPIVLSITRPVLNICFLAKPISFGAIDGEPVGVLFTLLSPTVRIHLHLISRLGFVLHNPSFKAALKRQAPQEEILAALSEAEGGLPPARGET